MSDVIVVAIITGICSVVGQWLITRGQNEKRKTDEAVRDARMEDRLSAVERKLDTHNSYAEKLSDIQTDIALIRQELKQIKETR